MLDFAQHQSLPCVRGGGPRTAARRDCAVETYEFALVFGEKGIFCRSNPSVKTGSEEPVLTAPFAQGSLGRCRARPITYNLQFSYTERMIATSREGPMVLFYHRPGRTHWLSVHADNLQFTGFTEGPCLFCQSWTAKVGHIATLTIDG